MREIRDQMHIRRGRKSGTLTMILPKLIPNSLLLKCDTWYLIEFYHVVKLELSRIFYCNKDYDTNEECIRQSIIEDAWIFVC